jgi:hypothetical protein
VAQLSGELDGESGASSANLPWHINPKNIIVKQNAQVHFFWKTVMTWSDLT